MKFWKTIVLSLLVAGLLAIAQHHHDDFDEHEDCPVCVLVQHGLDYIDYTPHVAVFWVVLFTLASTACAYVPAWRCNFYRPRGPPMLSA